MNKVVGSLRPICRRTPVIVTYYLVVIRKTNNYKGFLIIWAKLSDIFGRKLLIVTSLGHFVIFSGACGAAQTMNQLYVHAQIRWLFLTRHQYSLQGNAGDWRCWNILACLRDIL